MRGASYLDEQTRTWHSESVIGMSLVTAPAILELKSDYWELIADRAVGTNAMHWKDRLSSDPNVCHGRLCVKGTRVMVSVILDNLAAGESFDEIIEGYAVAREDIEACLHYAADQARDRVLALIPGVA